MKNQINNLSSFHFRRENIDTEYPFISIDNDGNEHIINKVIPDSEIHENMDCKDFRLGSLLNSGIDPSLHHIDTSSFNRSNDIMAFDNIVNEFTNSEIN